MRGEDTCSHWMERQLEKGGLRFRGLLSDRMGKEAGEGGGVCPLVQGRGCVRAQQNALSGWERKRERGEDPRNC